MLVYACHKVPGMLFVAKVALRLVVWGDGRGS